MLGMVFEFYHTTHLLLLCHFTYSIIHLYFNLHSLNFKFIVDGIEQYNSHQSTSLIFLAKSETLGEINVTKTIHYYFNVMIINLL